MNLSLPIRVLVATLALVAAATAQPFRGQMGSLASPPTDQRPPMLKQVGIDQHLDQQIPPDLSFRDESGKTVRLSDYFGKKPAILNLVYYQCPMLCGEVLSGMTSALGMVNFNIGKEFDVITVSIDPREGPDLAIAKKNTFVQRYRRPGAENGWHFLTGDQKNITALASAAGFGYEYDEASGQFAHATAIMVLTPDGKISRYLYGVDYPPKDLRLALVEASQRKIGGVVDQILLYCYHYNPATGKYGAIITNVLRIAGGITVFIVGAFVFVMFRRDTNMKHAETERVG